MLKRGARDNITDYEVNKTSNKNMYDASKQYGSYEYGSFVNISTQIVQIGPQKMSCVSFTYVHI